jgi:hypothetical protein
MFKPHASNVMHSFALHHTKLTLYIQRKYSFPAVLPGEHIEVEISKGDTPSIQQLLLMKLTN